VGGAASGVCECAGEPYTLPAACVGPRKQKFR
jgi:hypothetical protein